LNIPKSHPRFVSLSIREKIVRGYNDGLVAKEGLLAHGRGEAFDYLVGEKTSKTAKVAIMAAAAKLLSAQNPVISVNGNVAALCPKEVVQLAKATKAKIEVNLFYYDEVRKKKIEKSLKKAGAKQVLGTNPRSYCKIGNLDSPRRIVEQDGPFAAALVPLNIHAAPRPAPLPPPGPPFLPFSLPPLSLPSPKATITLFSNFLLSLKLLVSACKKSKPAKTNFNNRRALSSAVSEIKNNLRRRGSLA